MELFRQPAQNRIIVLMIAAAVDLLIGDPHWLWHPVQGIGSLIDFFEKTLRTLFSVPPVKPDTTDINAASAEYSEGSGNPESPESPESPENPESRESRESPESSGSLGNPGSLENPGSSENPGSPGRTRYSGSEKSICIRERIAGALMVILVLAVSTGIIFFLLQLCGRIHPFLHLLAEGVLCGRLLALRSLGQAGFSVRDPLLRGDLEGARKAVSMIVGRDTDRLDAEGIAKAAVETVAENTSDGVTAPLFYMILLGGIGGIFYKAVNTMDSMTGYKNPRYRYFGTAAARLDDVMNFIPARLTALFMILACCLPGKESVSVSGMDGTSEKKHDEGKTAVSQAPAHPMEAISSANLSSGVPAQKRPDMPERVLIPDGAAAFRVWKRDRLKSPSPNSAQTESVCAGALHLKLLGDTWYFGELHHKLEIGDGGRPVEPVDITRSVRLMNRCTALMFAAGIALLIVLFR
ncbi:MAG: cobalamin biosynthesis protein CobD [Lachnospiraceae bacterium]|nr:cobalamin biosynthesis protein CobD [Lachnospiraceae bacterium]